MDGRAEAAAQYPGGLCDRTCTGLAEARGALQLNTYLLELLPNRYFRGLASEGLDIIGAKILV